MRGRNPKQTGFTLVEVLMVAVILSILAIVVVPQFSDASTDVKNSALRTTLQTVRSQLELYKAQHNGVYPPTTDWVKAMTSKTNVQGTADSGDIKYGPYLQQMPVNPIDDSIAMAPSQDASGGWCYDQEKGTFKSNDSTANTADSKTKNL